MPPTATIQWAKEARDLPPDPVSGARVTRLSGSSIRTENIYCDAPRASPDGRRVASLRYIDNLLSPSKALMCHDLGTKFTCLIDREVTGWPVGPAWGGSMYYLSGTILKRASLESCTAEPLMDMAVFPRCRQFMSVSADERFLLYCATDDASQETAFSVNTASSSKMYSLVRVDLRERTWKSLLESPGEKGRLGGSYPPGPGAQMFIGMDVWEGDQRQGVGFLADAEGRNAREIFRRTHHACWLGNTGRFAGLVEFDYDRVAHKPEYPDGELHVYSADGTPPRLIPAREHLFFHISSSRCGCYVVCESLETILTGPMPIVIVNVETGKYRTLLGDCGCSAAGDASRNANPYFTADTRHVIFNADPDGIVNVHAAEIPPGFLESLK